MATRKESVEFWLEQLSGAEDVSCRPMMGEYVLCCRGKVIGGIYDDRFLVKPTRSALALMPNAPRELPYEGAKEMLLVGEAEDRAFLKTLAEAVADDLPLPKRKSRWKG